MKLLCINDKIINYPTVNQYGTLLKEGNIYETKGKSYNNSYGQPCYYIEGIGTKLVCRFTELLYDETDEEKAISKLKEEFQLN